MTIQEIAAWFNGELVGASIDPQLVIGRVSKIEEADTGSATFVANPKYEKFLATTQASLVLVSRKLDAAKYSERTSLVLLRVDDPYVSFLHLLKRLTPQVDPFSEGIHPTAVISQSARLGKNVSVGAYTVIGDEVRIDDDTKIGSGCTIGKQVQIGKGCLFYPHVTIYHCCRLANRITLHSGAVIGADGFGFAPKADGTYEKIPQLGIVVLYDDVEIGANTTIDRATLGETRIHRGVKIDNLVQVAHNVVIGEHTVIASQTGISGSTKIGRHCMIAGQVGIAGHVQIADRTVIMAQSGIPNSITEAGKSFFGYPADEARKAQRMYIAMKHVPDALRELAALQKKVAELEQQVLKQEPPKQS
ncbi:MAG TPA: UDP-3-O-(3-hydroxymyristoyl)glucosamine N-acyltransferase [Bacteroidota bacterium]|nr:UDP-3-O-(3-hydroxymyristoyl)glucosamine N-acyltransferase [Bacteroidota bacterium]